MSCALFPATPHTPGSLAGISRYVVKYVSLLELQEPHREYFRSTFISTFVHIYLLVEARWGVGRSMKDRIGGIGNTGRSVRQSMQAKQIRKKQRNKNIVYKGIMFDGANDRPYLNTN